MLSFMNKNAREVRKLAWILNRLDSSLVVKVKGLDFEHRADLLKYSIVSKLKEWQLDLEKKILSKINDCEKPHSGVHYIEHRVSKISSKIKLFELDFDKEEFKKIYYLLKTLEREIEDV